MIRLALCDDHPALRAGLQTVLRAEPGLVPVAAAGSEEDLWPILERDRIDVLILDYHLPGADGLLVCRRVREAHPRVRVLIYSAYASADLGIPAVVAGAHAVVNKGTPALELFEAIRRVAGGETILPPASPGLLDAAGRRVGQDLPILGMLLDGTPDADIAATLGITERDLGHRIERMLGRMRIDVPVPFTR